MIEDLQTLTIDELTREVREYNNFAYQMLVVEEQIGAINERISDLEHKKRKAGN